MNIWYYIDIIYILIVIIYADTDKKSLWISKENLEISNRKFQ